MLGAIVMQIANALTVASFASAAPNRQPSTEILAKIEASYSPSIAVDAQASGYSLYGCALSDLTITGKDPVTGNVGATKARVYVPPFTTESRSMRSIILLPPTGGENGLDRGYANTLCLSGFRVVLLQSWDHDTEAELDLGMHDKGALRSLAAIRRVTDYLNPEREAQIGLIGTSVGALSSSFALGYDKRLSTAVLIVGGVGMAEIIATTTEAGAAKVREARMKAMGFKSPADYLAALREHVTIEPEDFARFTGPKKVLAFVGTEDVTVPTKNQHDLVRAFGAESDEYAGDHTATILHTFALKQARIVEFFKTNLK